MRKNQGFALVKILPLLLILGAIVITAILLGQRTGWFNKADHYETPPVSSPWQFAAKFFGVNHASPQGYLLGNYGGLDLNTFTFEAWVKLDRQGDYGASRTLFFAEPISNQYSSPLHILISKQVYDQNTVLKVFADGKNGLFYNLEGKTHIPPGIWQHLAVVQDGKELRTYINGRLDQKMSMPTSPKRFPQGVQFGAVMDKQNGWFYNSLFGEMDELLVTRKPMYYSDFTPPKVPYSNLGPEAIWLLHFDKQAQSNGEGWYNTPNAASGPPATMIGAVGLLPSSVPTTTTLTPTQPPTVTPTQIPTVTITPFPPTLPPYPQLFNGTFDQDKDANLIPDGWLDRRLTSGDRLAGGQFLSPKYSFRFDPSTGNEILKQSLLFQGRADDALTLHFSDKVTKQLSGNTGGFIKLVYTNNEGAVKAERSISLSPHEWKSDSVTAVASKPFNRIVVGVYNNSTGGNVWYDNLLLKFVPGGGKAGMTTTKSNLSTTKLNSLSNDF